MNLFIDTNIFLSFYHLTTDDLEELKKLIVLLTGGEIVLHLPDQVKDEFRRNRENKISDSIKSLKGQRLNLQFPQICKDYDEYPKLRNLQECYEKQHANLIKKINKDVINNSLKADGIILEIFSNANEVLSDKSYISKARLRIDIGNPPGKRGSLGDAINWEMLLECVEAGKDIYFITDDRHYISSLDKNKFKEYLITEWKKKKNSEIIFYKKLSSFFEEHFPDIKLASMLEKELLIKRLASSSNFTRTHIIVSKLSKYTEFTNDQINDIIEATITNNQVYMIIDDDDVKEFINNIVESNEEIIVPENLNSLRRYIGDGSDEEDDDIGEIPFNE